MDNVGENCSYTNSFDAKDYFAAITITCDSGEHYIRVFALQQEAYSNIYADIPLSTS